MSFAAIAKVATINAGDDKSKSVLLWLAFHLNDDTGLCCPSISLLRKETEVGSDNTIRAALARLREKGLVSWTREIEDGCVKRTLYTLHLDTAKVEPTSTTKPTSAIEVPQPMKGGASTVDGGYFNGCAGVPQPLKGNKEIEHGKEQGKEQGMFFVESPSGDFDDAPPAGVEDVTEKVDRGTARIPACPYKKLVDLYHEVCPMLPTVTVLTPGRKTQLKARWTDIYREEHCTSEAECLENFRFIFNRVAASRFLTGRTDPGPNRSRPFVANLDWLIKAANFVKVCENRYSN